MVNTSKCSLALHASMAYLICIASTMGLVKEAQVHYKAGLPVALNASELALQCIQQCGPLPCMP